jgi:hypothetical protein
LSEQSRPGPLWGSPAPGAGPVPPQYPPPVVPPQYPPPPAPDRQRRLAPLYVAIAAAVCLLGGILAVAITKYAAKPDPAAAAAPVTTTETTPEPMPEPMTSAPAEAPVATTPPVTTYPPVTTTYPPANDAVPPSYRTVTGPAGVQVAIPADWTVKAGAVPSNLQADSPNGESLIRFGGSAAEGRPLLDTVASNETGNPNIASGYQRLLLEPVTSMATEAVDWEFEFVNKEGVLRHSYGRYWRLDGIDYVVYASSSADQWDTMTEVVDVMVRTAGPR